MLIQCLCTTFKKTKRYKIRDRMFMVHAFGSPAVQIDVEEDKLPGGEQTHLVSNQQELPDNKWFSPIRCHLKAFTQIANVAKHAYSA